jgi:molybdate transport system substrate-binding protein
MFRLSGTIALVLALLVPTAGAETLRVHAAASLTDVLEEIAAEYTKDTGTVVRFNFAGSSILARQIELGAPGDLFFSADEEKMNLVQGRGWILGDTRKSVLSNSLVVIVPSDSERIVRSARNLAGGSIKRIALAEPYTVPAGVYARMYLEAAGYWDQVAPKVVAMDNVRAALLAVEGGNVDAAIVYRTDAMTSDKVKVAYEVRPGEAPYISYPIAILSEAITPDEAARFIEYLSTVKARTVFEKHGFVVR